MTKDGQSRQDSVETSRWDIGLESFDPRKSGAAPRVIALAKLGLVGLFVIVIMVGIISVRNYLLITLPISPPSTAISEDSITELGHPSALSGTVDWKSDGGVPITHAPVVAGDAVIVAAGSSSATGQITALELNAGETMWTFRLGSIASGSPAVAGDFVYVGLRGGRIVCLDRHTGVERWSFQAEELAHGSPVVQDGVLYFASMSLYALDAHTGELRWRHELEGGRAITSVAVSQGVAAVLSGGNHLNLIDVRKGKRKYNSRLWFAPSGPPTLVGNMAVVSGDDGIVQTFDIHARDVPMWKAVRYWWIRLWSWDMAPRPPDPLGQSWHHRGVGGLSARVLSSNPSKLFLGVREADLSGGLAALDAGSGDLACGICPQRRWWRMCSHSLGRWADSWHGRRTLVWRRPNRRARSTGNCPSKVR